LLILAELQKTPILGTQREAILTLMEQLRECNNESHTGVIVANQSQERTQLFAPRQKEVLAALESEQAFRKMDPLGTVPRPCVKGCQRIMHALYP
jgi:hypothetical protein